MLKIILISGKSGHGKDEVAKQIKDKLKFYEKNTAITHYAKHMKDILYEFYDWDGVKTPWIRNKLQWMGTEKIRMDMNIPDFHVNRTCQNIDIIKEDFDYFIVADCRFPNEIEYVKNYFGENNVITIRVQRLNYTSLLSDEAQLHLSEISLDDYEDWDYKILALDQDLKGLERQCSVVVDKILE